MQRNPPEVKKKIRADDGFICAHPECSLPYLEYHHFDPPWSEKEHNNPNGIIALCPFHHRQADGGMYPKEILRLYKSSAKEKNIRLAGGVEWMRKIAGTMLGNNLALKNVIAVTFRDKPMVWLNYNEQGYALINIYFEDANGVPIINMVDSDWEIHPAVKDIEVIPSGKRIRIQINEKACFQIDFKDYNNVDELNAANKTSFNFDHVECEFPLSIINITAKLPLFGVEMSPTVLRCEHDDGRSVQLTGCLSYGQYVGFSVLSDYNGIF